MKKLAGLLFVMLVVIAGFIFYQKQIIKKSTDVLSSQSRKEQSYWLLLHRKSNIEYLYNGKPGSKENSKLIKTFKVKTGIPGERPTPLPQLLNRKYWIITEKHEEKENPETSPYFLTLNIPVSEEEPFGPTPYLECNGQCNWVIPGEFGLHGSGGNPEKLSVNDPGSSGCIRHFDEDITFLYKIIDTSEQIRYYIEDI